ncbi:hypothetical protein EEL35_08590 [Muribaculaceae bacterium Isolate-042 (Harlan)]|uniref:Uncharacterized protein n=1 Tax=Muribaculum intestinale TaxID=1796646 RepID=A0A1B1SCD2_9BACT|nr:hypothetical protein A4V02_12645 [Muribaculum intestinale]ASB37415.1 hypothetical protein ADH68_05060 [Muribaculum intestinale]PWB03788.1 hypothetical protein C5O29_06000 [Muribaculum intestinale]PWB10663.1 hypothetical protein C5O72_06105 [Muribaculum intestinale]ROS80460.1 hypothetical protein EEL35_08590 [Muribaculaceae bacterium Isolate-042 (Harlan)]
MSEVTPAVRLGVYWRDDPKCYYILIAVNIFVAILKYCYLAEKLVNKKSVGKLSFFLRFIP